MKMMRKFFTITVVISLLFSFNGFAMINNEYTPNNPATEKKNEDRSLDFRWVWLNDNECVQFNVDENYKRSAIEKKNEVVGLSHWIVDDGNNNYNRKTRDTYSGKWSQAEDETWSFEFDDHTIPVGVTKIDDVLYAFNTFGELKEGYEYYDGLTTGADGVVNSDDPEFLAWLETQYVPACTSHE